MLDTFTESEATERFFQLVGSVFACRISRRYCFYFAALWSTILVHLWLLGTNITATFILLVYLPWYISIPISTCIFSPAVGGLYCMLVQVENYFRYNLSMELKPVINWLSAANFVLRGR